MATLVCFHAHPDDECITTGGVMAEAKELGHRVVLVTATRGEHGEIADGVLAEGEQLWQRRLVELAAAAARLGVDRLEVLGYVDSGMAGDPLNDAPYAFCSTDVDHAAHRLASILAEEQPEVFTIYDDHGYYLHPDHIAVHRVGRRAAELVPVPTVLEVTLNRDLLLSSLPDEGPDNTGDGDVTDYSEWGTLEAGITHRIDVSSYMGLKREALALHASQVPADSWWLTMTDEEFAAGFGHEWFIEVGRPRAAGEELRTSIW